MMMKRFNVLLLLLSLVLLSVPQAGAKTVHSWDPDVVLGCYSVPLPWDFTDTVHAPCDATDPSICADCSSVGYGDPRFFFSNTNEDFCYANSVTGAIAEGSPVLPKWFSKTGHGTWAVGMGVDKYTTGSQYYDKYVFHGFNEGLEANSEPGAYLLQDVRVAFRMQQVQLLLGGYLSQTTSCSPVPSGTCTTGCACPDDFDDTFVVGSPIVRVTLGGVANWGGRDHYLEVVLWRTDNADRVTLANNADYCPTGWSWLDTSDNIYDRRMYYSGADVVYIYGPRLDKLPGMYPEDKTPNLTSAITPYEINIGRAFRSTPWSDYPSSWSGIQLRGVYIGVEVWGKAKMTIAFDNFEVYTP